MKPDMRRSGLQISTLKRRTVAMLLSICTLVSPVAGVLKGGMAGTLGTSATVANIGTVSWGALGTFGIRSLGLATFGTLGTLATAETAHAQTPKPVPPQIASESYILLDAETGTVLAEKNSDARLPPASLTKIMTAYLGFQGLENGALSLQQLVRVSRRAWAQNVIGSKTFLQVDTDVSIRDLLFGIIIQSGNDASIALAEALSGDETAFVAEMNAQAEAFGLTNTRFANTTGLPSENHYSSARDIAEIARRTTQDFPQYYPIYAEREFTYNNITQQNRNSLLGTFAGADGVKTGHTNAAGYCLAASAERNGRRLVAVVMKTNSPRERRREAEKLLTFGFSRFTNQQAFDSAKEIKIPVFQGVVDSVAVRPTESGLITVHRGAKVESVFTAANYPLTAPLQEGATVGEIEIHIDGEVLKKVPVQTLEAVAQGDIWKRSLDYIKWNYLGYKHEPLLSQW